MFTSIDCQTLIQNIDTGILIIDASHTIVLANHSASRLLGLGDVTVAGEKCFRVLAQGKKACPMCGWRADMKMEGPAFSQMERVVGGEHRSLRLKAFVLPSEGLLAIQMEDLTGEKEGEPEGQEQPAAIPCSQEWVESLLRSVMDGLIVTDEESRVLLMNAGAERLLEISQPLLFQPHLRECIHDRGLLKQLHQAMAKGEEGVRFEYEMGGRPAGDSVVAVEISPVRDRQGNVLGRVLLLRDITHQRSLDRMKNEFLSTAAHELRTPLTAIMGFSELLLTTPDLSLDQQREFLGFISEKSKNLSRIVSDLLDVSRIDSGRGLELLQEPSEINRLIRETVASYYSLSEKHSLDLELPEQEVVLKVDKGKIIQVLENLLSNAFKYSPRGGRIRVRAERIRGAYLLSVEDQGIGMNREQISRAFDRFYRGDSSHSAVEGTGLGLSICKHIVEAHRGRIWLQSRKGKGTTAYFTLPMLRE